MSSTPLIEKVRIFLLLQAFIEYAVIDFLLNLQENIHSHSSPRSPKNVEKRLPRASTIATIVMLTDDPTYVPTLQSPNSVSWEILC